MKSIKHIIVAMFVAVVGIVFTSCNNDPATDKLRIEIAETITIDGIGGKVNIPYSIKGENSVQPTVSSDAEWLRNFKVAGSVIQCDAEGNPTTSERTATITVTCGEVSATVTATQGVADSDFVINISDLSPYSCYAHFVPINHEGPFFFLVVSKSYFELHQLTGDFSNLYEEDAEWLADLAEYYGVSLAELLAASSQMYSSDGAQVDMRYSDLSPETEYVAYCYGMAEDGTRTTDICYTEFKTTIVATSDIEFTLNVTDITASSAHIEVTPSNSDFYYWTYISEMDYAQYDDYAVMQNMLSNISAEVAKGASIYDIIHTGSSSQTPSKLWSGTKYHIIAWGMDARCNPTTQPFNIGSFTTLSAGVNDDCTFEISCPEVGQTDILINVKPSNNSTRYMICPVENGLCGAYGDEQMAQRLINMEQQRFNEGFYGVGVSWANAEWIFSGEQTKWGRADLDWTFEADKTYRIYVFGVDHNGTRTTQVARFDQRTSDVEASDMTFTVELVHSTWDHPVFRITPSKDDEYWVACLMQSEYVDWYRNDDGSINEDEMMEMLDEEYFDGQTKYFAKMGTDESTYYWSSDSQYTMLVYGWSGSNTTPIFEYEFSTPSIPWGESDAAVEVKWDLFDGAELAKMDPMMWAGYEENCIIYIEYTPNASAAHWYGGVWLPVSSYELGVDHLIPLLKDDTVSHVDRAWGRYVGLDFTNSYSLSWFAEDAEGRFGEWGYVEFTPKRGEDSNMSEPYDFWTNPKPNGMTLVM